MVTLLLVLSITLVALIRSGRFQAFTEKSTHHQSQILVRFKKDLPETSKAKIRQTVGATKVKEYKIVPGLELLNANIGSERALQALSNNPNIEYAEFDSRVQPLVVPNDTHFATKQWGLNSTYGIDAPQGWDITIGDSTVVANIDTGVQLDHPDLVQNIYTNIKEIAGNNIDDDQNGFVDDVHGWDFYNNDNDPTDTDGHGTHTAGTFAAVTNNLLGVAGVCWNCKIMPIRFLGPDGGDTSGAISSIEYAVLMNVRVSNNSWGGGSLSQALQDTIEASKSIGHVFVAAAGNSSNNSDISPLYPAAYPNNNIISVAAIDRYGQLTYFSNYGPTTVDLGAPGYEIASTYLGGLSANLNGTSMAAPHVAGAVAMLLGSFPGWTYQQVKERIVTSARPLASLEGKTVSGGILNLPGALNNAPPSSYPKITINNPGNLVSVVDGATIQFVGSSTDVIDGNLTSQMIWTDDIQGQIGTGGSFTRNDLSYGSHLITAKVTDSEGKTNYASVRLTINTPPTISVSSPAANSIFALGPSLSFTGEGLDKNEGNISSRLVWDSSLQGRLGTGGSFSRNDLKIGTHNITVSLLDNFSARASKSFSIKLEDQATSLPTAPVITTISSSDSDKAYVTVRWQDNSSNEAGFEIESQTKSGGKWSTYRTPVTTQYNVIDYSYQVVPRGLYRFRVRAVNKIGASTWSAWKEFKR